MSRLLDEELWDRYQTELREIYDRKKSEKPIYPLFHLVKGYFQGSAFPIQLRVVEIGFGNGGLLISLASIFTVCYGLDISQENIELTRSQFKEAGITNVHFEQHNIMDTPRYTDFFDVMVLSHVLEHFDDEELGIVLSCEDDVEIGRDLLWSDTL